MSDRDRLVQALMGLQGSSQDSVGGLLGVGALLAGSRSSQNAYLGNAPPSPVKNFVQRYLTPSRFPSIQNTDGSYSTHRMASAETDGKFIVYPTIVQLPDGNLRELGDDEAYYYALKTGEFMEFPSDKEARAFAEGGYKRMSLERGYFAGD